MPGGPNNLVASYTPGPDRSNYNGPLGTTFIPSAAMTFNKIGIRCGKGTLGPKTVALRSTVDGEIARATIDLTGGTLDQWFYADMPSITLVIGRTYVLWVQVTSGDGYVYFDSLSNNCTLGNCSSWSSCWGTSLTGAATTANGHAMYHGVDLNYVVAVSYVDLTGSLSV